MGKNKKRPGYDMRGILHVVFIITLIACIALGIAMNIYLCTHVKGAFLMGTKDGYSLFETIYLFRKAPEAMITGYISAAGAFGSVIGIVLTR